MNKKVTILFLGIIILSVALRLWQLGHVPPSPDWDEAALGYDAYSIIHTGRDEFGKFLPVVLRSFDDYKPALYAYLAIPTVALLGLNLFAVRLPSAIFGVVSVVAVFYLVRELFENHKIRDSLSITAAFLFAISPWSLQFSRVAFESSTGDTFNILCALFLIKGLKKPWMLSLSAIFAGLSIYIYQSEKAFTPLLVLLLVLVYAKKLIKLPKKYLISAFVVGLIVILPMVFYIINNHAAFLRIQGTSIFSDQTVILGNDIQKLRNDQVRHDTLGLVLDNRRVIYTKDILYGYISHFSLNWLFITGDISRHHAPGVGIIYLFELPFILIGMYLLLFGDFDKRTKWTVFLWLLAAPIPASITTGVPHAVRTLNFLPTWQIFSALGLITVLIFVSDIKYRISSIKLKYFLFAAGFLIFAFNFTYYLNQYFVQQNYYDSADWQYGYEQAVSETQQIGAQYKKIVVSDSNPMDKSYMFFLFYLGYSPSDYQKIGANSSGSFVSHHHFGKYEFRAINWNNDVRQKDTLFVGPPAEVPSGAPIIKTIYNLDGSVAIRIAGNK